MYLWVSEIKAMGESIWILNCLESSQSQSCVVVSCTVQYSTVLVRTVLVRTFFPGLIIGSDDEVVENRFFLSPLLNVLIPRRSVANGRRQMELKETEIVSLISASVSRKRPRITDEKKTTKHLDSVKGT
jgi:hypothetical protein